MPIKYLIDENLPPVYQEQLKNRVSDLVVLRIGDPNTPSIGTLDPEILSWCEKFGFILVTNNRSSMPVHLADHLNNGDHIPGILVLRKQANFGQVIEDLILISLAAEENEYQDIISYVPLKK
jgi:predicted nuclease of predicted toxin-antitoxin system